MINDAEQKVSRFYNTVGWETDAQVTEDARRWEDLRVHSRRYVSDCRLRILRHIPPHGERLLDMASGPIQYPEYLEYSKNFIKRYCVDLSAAALQAAEKKIGGHGVFLHGSFFDLPLEDDCFDCAISLHTIYHMDKTRQEEAVRKLIRVTKPGQPIIIIYSNPDTYAGSISRLLKTGKAALTGRKAQFHEEGDDSLYFYAHPIAWWKRFEDAATVNVFPWRAFGVRVQKMLFPDNRLGAWMLGQLFALEDRFPDFFVRHFLYPMIVLTKK